MNATRHVLLCAVCAVFLAVPVAEVRAQETAEIVRYEEQRSSARLEPARMGDQAGLAVVFAGTNDLHYYAKSESAPAPGYNLKISASAEGVTFGEPVFPQWVRFYDVAQEKNIEVYVGNFTVFLPFANDPSRPFDVTVKITGLACTSQLCLPPFEKTLAATIDPGTVDSWTVLALETSEPSATSQVVPTAAVKESHQAVLPYSTGVYYLLAILAGISINIMPCVLPVIPLILMRLITRAKQPGGNRIVSGLAFCAGVVLFFAAFALVSAVINLTTGAVLDLNSLFRYPSAVIVLFLAIVFFGLAMLDVITLSLPSSVAGRQGSGSGIVGTAGMGFFAGVLSTPCSGALLGFVLVWAQTQTLLVSSTAIVLMGLGMALPYAIIVSIPSLLDKLPKPGTWMEIFKKSTGFLLFLIAAKLTLAALPRERLLNVLMYGIIFSFCVWMWGKWVGFGTPAGRRRLVRGTALTIAVAAGFWLLPPVGPPAGAEIAWQPYSRDVVQSAVAQKQAVLLKFTADWCSNCKEVEKRVYHVPEVAELIAKKNVLPIKADTTAHDYPATIDFEEIYGEAGNVPVTIVLLPDGTQTKLRGIFGKQDLIDILEKLPEVAS